MDICRIYADFCMYAVAFLLSFLIFVCELSFAEYMRRPIINEKLPISESNPIKARYYDYDRFTYPWHFHSQYEIIYVKESHGLCFVGDCIEKFSAGDVILFGTNLPHYMRSNDIYGSENATSRVQGTIIQFEQNFMQYSFDYYPQFLQIKILLEESKRGVIFPKQDATRVGELAEELLQASLILGDVREVLGVGAVQVGLSGTSRAAVARAHDDHSVLLVISNETVDVADEEVQARGGAPVTDQTVLDVFAGERLLHQRVATQIDLADGEVVGCAPVLIHAFDSFLGNRSVQLLPRGANNRTRHVYSCTPAL